MPPAKSDEQQLQQQQQQQQQQTSLEVQNPVVGCAVGLQIVRHRAAVNALDASVCEVREQSFGQRFWRG
jgi:hypothetical protein